MTGLTGACALGDILLQKFI